MNTELRKLLEACKEAVSYVGMANYAERQRYAQHELSRVFKAYVADKSSEIKFGIGKDELRSDEEIA
jgi:hypothetical protein